MAGTTMTNLKPSNHMLTAEPHASPHGGGLPNAASIRADRVERLRARIAAGQYAIDPVLIAEALLACDSIAPGQEASID
jgi:anti-sigma28 factor (negative regulator of flagellin synthesis)